MQVAPTIKECRLFVNKAMTEFLTYVKVSMPHELVNTYENINIPFRQV